MNNKIIEIPNDRFYKLPFENGNFKLTRTTLDLHSEFRKPRHVYLSVEAKMNSFTNDILTFSISIAGEEEEFVYLKVTQTHLFVSCSVDTDETYLSRYAYFLLDNYISYYHEKDLSEYYWPDFFDATGKSKYLVIEKKAKSLHIKLKGKYWFFYKPGCVLPEISKENRVRHSEISENLSVPKSENENMVISYCLLDPLNLQINKKENRELTLLIPFLATLNNDRRTIKSMIKYISLENSVSVLEPDENQYLLNNICFEMWENTLFCQTKSFKKGDHLKCHEERDLLQFDLWNKALPLLVGQRFVSYQRIYGLRYIKGKPIKKDIYSSQFSSEIPLLKFFLIDKGDYYSFEIRFMVDGKLFKFSRHLMTYYFAASDIEPRKFYLLGSKADAEIVSFFARINFSIQVLKKHYATHFKGFADQIRAVYGLREK